MEPQFVDKPEMTLVGIVGCASDVNHLDIHGLWERFSEQSEEIRHPIEGVGYELHMEREALPPMHFCLVGVEVEKIEALPIELFAKVIPAGRYAVFTHRFAEGGYDDAFRAVYEWIGNSAYALAHPFDLQCFDARFRGSGDPESVIEIHVPIAPKKA
jgi:AraC family transcriptional regulator